MVRTHVTLAHSHRPQKSGAFLLCEADPKAIMHVTLKLKAPRLPSAGMMPSNALTPAEFAKRYGASPANVDRVKKVLQKYRLSVDGPFGGGRSLRATGTTAAMEVAFETKLSIYHSPDQGDFRGRVGCIKVPVELANIVTGVFGLDQRRMAKRRAAAVNAPHGEASGLMPTDLEKRYNFPPGDGAEQAIAVAEFGEPDPAHDGFVNPHFCLKDLTPFCKVLKRSRPAVHVIHVNGAQEKAMQSRRKTVSRPNRTGNSSAQTVDTLEAMLDIQIIAGLCPQSTIFVYLATFDEKGWIDLLDNVCDGHPTVPVVLSVSWGRAEDSPDWSEAARNSVNDGLKAAAMLGITVCASAGDDGSGDDMNDSRAHVEFPASSPYVLAVGGTMLNGAAQKEVVWWQAPGQRTDRFGDPTGGGATGGGVSVKMRRPPWQTVTVLSINKSRFKGRLVPDVAALAGRPFYRMLYKGKWQTAGGTSGSTPLWASLIARINACLPSSVRQRFSTPLLYLHGPGGKPIGKVACRDVRLGDNRSCPQPGEGYVARKGYDAVTGWGVPDGKRLLSVLSKIPHGQ